MADNNHTRKISVTGSTRSYYVTLPKDAVRVLKWQKGQRVVVQRKGKELVIRDWVPGD